MKARDIMSRGIGSCTPEDRIQRAAELMEKHDCGSIPVEDARTRRIVGVVTDRDIALRAVAAAKSPGTPVLAIMSADPSCCSPDDDLEDVERIMEERQVRRVPVIDTEGRCVGIIAQADLATHRPHVGDREIARVVERISEPTGAPRREAEVGRRPSAVHAENRAEA